MRKESGPPRPLVAVLGASGLIGSVVVSALSRRKAAVRAVARGRTAVPLGDRVGFQVRSADLTRPGAVEDVVEGASAVVHLLLDRGGWRGPDDGTMSDRVDVGVVRDLVTALRKRSETGPPPVVVFAGSTSQRGSTTASGLAVPDRPASAYDRRKEEAESLLRGAASEGVVRAVPLRLPTVFGPAPAGRLDKGVISAMARRALAGEPLTMWHDGTVRREFLYVDDVADAFLLALDHADALTGRPWCLGSDRSTPLSEVMRRIAELASEHTGGTPVPVTRVPAPEHATESDFTDMVVDSSAFRSATGWRPRVPLDEALRRTVASIARRGSPPLPGPTV